MAKTRLIDFLVTNKKIAASNQQLNRKKTFHCQFQPDNFQNT